MLYPDVEVVLAIATAMRVSAVRDMGLLVSAIERPQVVLYGIEVYPDPSHKCAALLESLVKNHPLFDGNKRLGWATVASFLDANLLDVVATDDEAFDFVIAVASGEAQFDDMVAWFDARIVELSA